VTLLRNCWYMAAWSDEVGPAPLARRLLNEPIVFFRDINGQVAAFPDRCPHRFAPLSMGQVVEGGIQCRYHGLRFDRTGRCVYSPYSDQPPARASLAPIPLVERDGFIWFWAGNVEAADPATVPDMAFLFQTPTTDLVRMHVTQRSSFLLGIDNLMDPSHVPSLHADSLAPPPDMFRHARYSVIREEGRVTSLWRFPDADGEFPDHQWLKATYSPPGTVLTSAGLDMLSGAALPPGILFYNLHVLTPETATSAHYFSADIYDRAKVDPDFASQRAALLLDQVFGEEDDPILAGIEARMAGEDFFALNPALLPIDGGAVEARRLHARLSEAESRTARPAGFDTLNT